MKLIVNRGQRWSIRMKLDSMSLSEKSISGSRGQLLKLYFPRLNEHKNSPSNKE